MAAEALGVAEGLIGYRKDKLSLRREEASHLDQRWLLRNAPWYALAGERNECPGPQSHLSSRSQAHTNQ